MCWSRIPLAVLSTILYRATTVREWSALLDLRKGAELAGEKLLDLNFAVRDALFMRELEKRGHNLKRTDSIGAAQAVGVSSTGRGFVGAHDPRVEGKAAGW